jgi:ribose/xylose/arabinose/galactoside ABC-type transport system permease subunit
MKEKSHSFLFLLIRYLMDSILVGIICFVFMFSVIPNYIKLLGEPRPIADSLLRGLIWGILFALIMSVYEMRKARRK